MSLFARLYSASRRRKAAANLSEFASVIASPVAMGTGAAGTTFTFGNLPGPGRLAISGSAGLTAGKVRFGRSGVTDKLAGVTTVAANVIVRGLWEDETAPIVVVTVVGQQAGTLTLYVLNEADEEDARAIAHAVVT